MLLGLIFLEKSDCRHYCPVSSGHIIQVFGSYKGDRKGSVCDDVMAGGAERMGKGKDRSEEGNFQPTCRGAQSRARTGTSLRDIGF